MEDVIKKSQAEEILMGYEGVVTDAFCKCSCEKFSENYNTRYVENGCVPNCCKKHTEFCDIIREAGKSARKKIYNNPLLKSWKELKDKKEDRLILFRCGNHYETWNEDATTMAKVLGLSTSIEGGIRRCGFPHHALDTYLPKLIRAGHRIYICDRLEESKKGGEK